MKTAEKAGRLFFAVLGLAGLLLLILPRIGISVDMVLSGSMEPKIRTGGLVFTDTNRKDPKIGDIITYSLNDSFVTHRVVRKEGSTLITKGARNGNIYDTVSRISGSFYEAKNNFCHIDPDDRSGVDFYGSQ